MARFPKSISMAGHEIAVVIDETIGDYGQFSLDDMRITLAPGTPESMAQTLRHEMVHAALALSGIAYIERLPEEAIVRALDTIFWPCYQSLPKRTWP
jgi:hypothetical protein